MTPPPLRVLTVDSFPYPGDARVGRRVPVFVSIARGRWACERESVGVVVGVAMAHRVRLARGEWHVATDVMLVHDESEAWRQ